MLFAWLVKIGDGREKASNDTLSLVPLKDDTIETLKAAAQAIHFLYIKDELQSIPLTWVETGDGESYTAYETAAIREGATLRPFYIIRIVGSSVPLYTARDVTLTDIPF